MLLEPLLAAPRPVSLVTAPRHCASRKGRAVSPRLLLACCLAVAGCSPASTPNGAPAPAPGGGVSPLGGKMGSEAPVASITITDPFRLRNLAKVHADRDTKEGYLEAARYLGRLVELSPKDPNDRLNQAKALLFSEATDEADRALGVARELFGASAQPDLEYVDALIHKRRNDPAGARERFAKVTEMLPQHLYAWFQRGAMEEQSRDPAAAEKSYRRTLELQPQYRAGAYRLGMVLQRLGRVDEGKELLQRSQTMPERKEEDNEKCELTAVTLRPLERARVEPPAVTFHLEDATERLLGREGSAGAIGARPLSMGPAAEPGLLILTPTAARIVRLEKPRPVIAAELAASGVIDGLAADLDNDDADDILVRTASALRLFRGDKEGKFEPAEAPGLTDTPYSALAAEAFDADHDGDLDIVALLAEEAGASLVIIRNNGDKTFTRLEPVAMRKGSPPDIGRRSLAAHDVDQANDLDLITALLPAGPLVHLNRREGRFIPAAVPGLENRSIVLVDDLDNDGAPDFLALGGSPGWALALNADRRGAPYQLHVREASSGAGAALGTARDATLADLDNDGDLDALVVGPAGFSLLRNTRGGTLVEEPPVALPGGAAGLAVEAVDLDRDGALEVLIATSAGGLCVLASGMKPGYAGVELCPFGGKDNRDAVGVVVEVYAGSRYQSVLIREAAGVHLGLGAEGMGGLDGLRLRWPQGIVQAMPSSDCVRDDHGRIRFRQKEGLVASCPFLYARGPEGWSFLTDVLGIAPLDEWLPPGVEPQLDPEEHVRIEGKRLAPVDGLLRLAVTEELRETAYLDRLELVVVEHPDDVEVYTDESTRQPAYGPLEVAMVRRGSGIAPGGVRVGGQDVRLELLAEADGRFVHGYPEAPSQWGGWVPPYDLEVSCPREVAGLLLTGRVAWYDSTVVYSLHQSHRTWAPPRLDLVEPAGRVRTLTENLGVPCGMDRTIVWTFDAPVAPGSTLRLQAQHRLLWDRLQLVSTLERGTLEGAEGLLEVHGGDRLSWRTLPVRSARLDYHGFSRSKGDKARHEQTYVYEEASADDSFAPAVGWATRHGDVRELLLAHDDELVVLVSGDGVEVDFEAPAPPGPGARQTYFLRVSGWAKEAGYHNATGRSIEPLPRRSMTSYPPRGGGTGEAPGEADARYREAYQTREVRPREP